MKVSDLNRNEENECMTDGDWNEQRRRKSAEKGGRSDAGRGQNPNRRGTDAQRACMTPMSCDNPVNKAVRVISLVKGGVRAPLMRGSAVTPHTLWIVSYFAFK